MASQMDANQNAASGKTAGLFASRKLVSLAMVLAAVAIGAYVSISPPDFLTAKKALEPQNPLEENITQKDVLQAKKDLARLIMNGLKAGKLCMWDWARDDTDGVYINDQTSYFMFPDHAKRCIDTKPGPMKIWFYVGKRGCSSVALSDGKSTYKVCPQMGYITVAVK